MEKIGLRYSTKGSIETTVNPSYIRHGSGESINTSLSSNDYTAIKGLSQKYNRDLRELNLKLQTLKQDAPVFSDSPIDSDFNVLSRQDKAGIAAATTALAGSFVSFSLLAAATNDAAIVAAVSSNVAAAAFISTINSVFNLENENKKETQHINNNETSTLKALEKQLQEEGSLRSPDSLTPSTSQLLEATWQKLKEKVKEHFQSPVNLDKLVFDIETKINSALQDPLKNASPLRHSGKNESKEIPTSNFRVVPDSVKAALADPYSPTAKITAKDSAGTLLEVDISREAFKKLAGGFDNVAAAYKELQGKNEPATKSPQPVSTVKGQSDLGFNR